MLVLIVQSMGVINLEPPLSLLIGAGFGVIAFGAYAIDRLVSPKLGALGASLVFPLSLCSIEYLTSRVSPYGSFGSIAYSQTTNLALLQVLSVTGLCGVTFVVAWSASTFAGLYAARRDPGRARAPTLAFAAVFLAVIGFGEVRLAASSRALTVRVAAISPKASDGFHFMDAVGDPCLGHDCDGLRARAVVVQDELIADSRLEADAGAKAIVWSEDAGTTFKDGEPGFVARGQALAREKHLTLVMALQVLTPGRRLAENKVVVAGPDGDILARYEKSRPVPGDLDLPGDGRIPVVSTQLGRVATAICFDLDFPTLMRQVGRSGADLLMVPASDWREIDPLHARMAVYRAIENGASLVRATRRGLSIATDPMGRPIGALDFFTTDRRILVVDAPMRGVWTLYPRIGDLFAWIAMGGLAALLASSARSPTPAAFPPDGSNSVPRPPRSPGR